MKKSLAFLAIALLLRMQSCSIVELEKTRNQIQTKTAVSIKLKDLVDFSKVKFESLKITPESPEIFSTDAIYDFYTEYSLKLPVSEKEDYVTVNHSSSC